MCMQREEPNHLICMQREEPKNLNIVIVCFMFRFIDSSVDISTATMAKQALEGHCIYDGGYCKLRLTYSRHTDLNVKVHKDQLLYVPKQKVQLKRIISDVCKNRMLFSHQQFSEI